MLQFFFICCLLGFISSEVLCFEEETRLSREEFLRQLKSYDEEIAKRDEELEKLDIEISDLPNNWEQQKNKLKTVDIQIIDLESENYYLKREIKIKQDQIDNLKEKLEEKEIQCFTVEESENQTNISRETFVSQLESIDSDIKKKDEELQMFDLEINKLEDLENKHPSLWDIEREECEKIRVEKEDCQLKMMNKGLKERNRNPPEILSKWQLDIKNLLISIKDRLQNHSQHKNVKENKNINSENETYEDALIKCQAEITRADDTFIRATLEFMKKEMYLREKVQNESDIMRKWSRNIIRFRQNITALTENLSHTLVIRKINRELNMVAKEIEYEGIQNSNRVLVLNWDLRKCNNSFNKDIEDYKKGFGSDTYQLSPNSSYVPHCQKRSSSFFIGLENIHRITANGNYSLYIELKTPSGTKYSTYNHFKIRRFEDRYQIISLGKRLGTAGNLMENLKLRKFSTLFTGTKEEIKCAQHFKFGWWYPQNCMKNPETNIVSKFYAHNTQHVTMALVYNI